MRAAALARAGQVDSSQIDTEQRERDNSSNGASQAARAKAGIPTSEELEAAWDPVTNGRTINSVQRASALGFCGC